MGQILCEAVELLRSEFAGLNWIYRDGVARGQKIKMFTCPGPPDEDIMVVVHQSCGISEELHHHDYFYFNYTYQGSYDSLSRNPAEKITVQEGELYAGQPFSAHALCAHDDKDTTIIGVLIKKNTMIRTLLPLLSLNSRFLHFLVAPAADRFSSECIHFKLADDCNIRTLLEMMVIEYAHRKADSQAILKPLALAFLSQVARQYVDEPAPSLSPAEQMVHYISEHADTVSLAELASRFAYHPNYISALLHRQTGRTFSQLLTEKRMERAVLLLRGTDLPVEKIAFVLGYSNSSNFYKAFREAFNCSPREYVDKAQA